MIKRKGGVARVLMNSPGQEEDGDDDIPELEYAEPVINEISGQFKVPDNSLDDDDAMPTELYAALSESVEDESGESDASEFQEEEEEEEEKMVVKPEKKKKGGKKYEKAYYRHLENERKKQAESKWSIHWVSSIINLLVVFVVALVYMYYTYGIYSMMPPDTFRPSYPLMIADIPYNTTSRLVSDGEIKREALGSGSNRIPLYLIFRTLRWYAENKGYVVVCAHHLQHGFEVHPQICVLHNKVAGQSYSMINPILVGFSKEKDVRVEESVACGRTKNAKSRYKTAKIAYTTHPSKQHMQVEFYDQEASTLQLVMDEMNGKYSCK
jgi:hypothetical protein